MYTAAPAIAFAAEHRDAAHEQPDVADRRERQQALEVALDKAHPRSEQRRDHAGGDEDRPQCIDMRAEHPREHHPVQARDGIHAELDHHP